MCARARHRDVNVSCSNGADVAKVALSGVPAKAVQRRPGRSVWIATAGLIRVMSMMRGGYVVSVVPGSSMCAMWPARHTGRRTDELANGGGRREEE